MWTALVHWDALRTASTVFVDPAQWVGVLVAWIALKLLHETFHGLASKKYGAPVTEAGVMFCVLAPVAYIDVTSTWRLSSRRERIIVAAAGMYAELFVAALAIVAWANTGEGLLHRMCLVIAATASIGTLLVNLNPLMRFDGYYILSDLLDIPNLSTLGRQYVAFKLRRWLLGLDGPPPAMPVPHSRTIKLYALGSLAWRVMLYTSLALVAVRLLSWGGVLIVASFAGAWLVLPALREGWCACRASSNTRRWRSCAPAAPGS
jgi:putative peptide zinc metalloprotease protein